MRPSLMRPADAHFLNNHKRRIPAIITPKRRGGKSHIMASKPWKNLARSPEGLPGTNASKRNWLHFSKKKDRTSQSSRAHGVMQHGFAGAQRSCGSCRSTTKPRLRLLRRHGWARNLLQLAVKGRKSCSACALFIYAWYLHLDIIYLLYLLYHISIYFHILCTLYLYWY